MNIRIVGRDKAGDCMMHLKMSSSTLALQAFAAITCDLIHQDLNWYLEIDGEIMNWHCPLNDSKDIEL